MVTAGASKSIVVTGAAIVGLFFGFWVQEEVKIRAEARVEKRIQTEFTRRLEAKASGLADPSGTPTKVESDRDTGTDSLRVQA